MLCLYTGLYWHCLAFDWQTGFWYWHCLSFDWQTRLWYWHCLVLEWQLDFDIYFVWKFVEVAPHDWQLNFELIKISILCMLELSIFADSTVCANIEVDIKMEPFSKNSLSTVSMPVFGLWWATYLLFKDSVLWSLVRFFSTFQRLREIFTDSRLWEIFTSSLDFVKFSLTLDFEKFSLTF